MTIHPVNDDLNEKISEHERRNVKVGAKIFINNNSEANLEDAIDNILKVLQIDYLDNLILAFHPNCHKDATLRNGDVKEGVLDWGGGDCNALSDLQKLWKVLERYSLEKKVYPVSKIPTI